MLPEDIAGIRETLPETLAFDHYADRESAWLLKTLMPERAAVRDLRAAPYGKLLERPLIRPLLAASGGILRRSDVAIVAEPGLMAGADALKPRMLPAMSRVFDLPWLDFELSFDGWASRNWQWAQLSRPGGNLVVQLGFPGEHAALLERYLSPRDRAKFESPHHPVRRSGRPTLAWARLDIDVKTGTALIEEIQSDWLRYVRAELWRLQARKPRSRALAATAAYEAALTERYEKLWARAMMLAVLMLLRDRLAVREVFLHRPTTGAVLKHIWGTQPPRSLYTALPRAFCFEPTRDIPGFLRRKRRKDLRRLPRNQPLFWHLQL